MAKKEQQKEELLKVFNYIEDLIQCVNFLNVPADEQCQLLDLIIDIKKLCEEQKEVIRIANMLLFYNFNEKQKEYFTFLLRKKIKYVLKDENWFLISIFSKDKSLKNAIKINFRIKRYYKKYINLPVRSLAKFKYAILCAKKISAPNQKITKNTKKLTKNN